MIDRCANPRNIGWLNYGGRGITVCDRWLDFDVYYADVGDAPPGMSLDRVDNDGNYEASNVRWATPFEQTHNRRAFLNFDALKTRCPQSHPYDEANTYVSPKGHRFCRACNRDACARYRAARHPARVLAGAP